VRQAMVVLADLDRPGAVALAARGGRGGRGNTRFATATRQAPRAGELGDPGRNAASTSNCVSSPISVSSDCRMAASRHSWRR